MENSGYTTLTRQAGLLREMQVVANNIANAATTGFRQQGLGFSEYVQRVDNGPSLSMAEGNVRLTSYAQGAMTMTGDMLDFAIEGDGFFLIDTPEGQMLTRAGSFTTNAAGDLVTLDGYAVLDAGGAPIFIPPDAAGVSAAGDGTLSANGQPIGQIGIVVPENIDDLTRTGNTRFAPNGGFVPAEDPRLMQGFLESSNVDPISQIARMIEVQRAYEMGQNFLQSEDERLRNVVETLMK